jgi:hypothetical protein
MKNKGEPLATMMALTTLVIIGVSTKHCIKKYSHMDMPRHGILVHFKKRSHAWKVI